MAGSLETNKLIGGMLTAGIIVVGSSVISDLLYYVPRLDQPVFAILVADDTAVAEAEDDTPAVPLAVLLASASADDGQRGFRACAACHSVDEGGAHRVGPNLWNVLGNDIAGKDGFRYSATLAGLDGEWTYEKMDGFLRAPGTWAPGTSMSFAGIANDAARADMIAYLRSLSNDPKPLPEAPDDATEEVPEGGEASGQGR